MKKLMIAVLVAMSLPIAASANFPENLVGTAFFEIGHDDISKETEWLISRIFRITEIPQCANITLVGHGCELGEDELNLDLGNRRAIAVRDALVQKGFSEDRITIQTVGKREPTYVWMTVYPDKKYNRAVEIYIEPRSSWYDDFKCEQKTN